MVKCIEKERINSIDSNVDNFKDGKIIISVTE